MTLVALRALFSGVMVFAFFTALLHALEHRVALRRWARRAIRCKRGANCAVIRTTRLDAPAGSALRMTYRCDRCGTEYVSEVLALGDGHWVEVDRERAPA